ncbi:MAG: hypothetical protein ABUK13_10125 [Gammaproteobacteria bacterium]
MKNITSDFVVGGVARNDDFYFHKTFISDVWDSLRKDNVLLLSPRRTGKTSVMYCMLDNPENGYRVIHLNVEDLETPAEFYLSLIDAINDHQPEYMKKLSSSWDLFKGLGNRLDEIGWMDFKIKLRKATDWEQRWKELAQQLIEKVIAADESVLFIIDELPDMLSAMSEKTPELLKEFLHQFRKIRIGHKGNDKIRWLVGGSVNIRGTLDDLGLTKQINDLKTESLPIIKEQEVGNFVSMMLDDREVLYDESLTPRIYQLLGEPIPFFLQLFTQELFRYWRREKPELLNASHAENVFQHALLGEAAHDKLQHYHSRIQLYYPQDDQEVSYILLDALSLSEQGISKKGLFSQYQKQQHEQSKQVSARTMQQAFKRLLLRLESDFYISKNDDDYYGFNSFLLKTWWRKNWAYIYE